MCTLPLLNLKDDYILMKAYIDVTMHRRVLFVDFNEEV